MFDLLPMLLSSIACYLFPIFASYKALKTSDPSELTPWLMYWVVLSCCLLVENWVWFIVSWIPFYGYFRLIFLLYLILPQTQGARHLYEEKLHPWLAANENQIDDFIAKAHGRLTSAGLAYLQVAIEAFKTKVLGLPPTQPVTPPPETQSYTQSLLSRFNVPAAKWAGSANSGSDFYSLLSSAVAAATNSGGQPSGTRSAGDVVNPTTLIPPHLRNSNDRMSFISAQRDRLNIVLAALDREAQDMRTDAQRAHDRASDRRAPSMSFDGNDYYDEPTQRPPSSFSSLGRSRSEADFEKIDAESGAEDEGMPRRRNVGGAGVRTASGGSWVPWGWGEGSGEARHPDDDLRYGGTSGYER